MFIKACKLVRECTYGVIGTSILKQNGPQVTINTTNATAFMIVPGFLITAAHFIHQENKPDKPIHQTFEATRIPDIGGKMEKAVFVAEDSARDIALLKIENSKNSSVVKLKDEILPRGTNCGFLGFPLANVEFTKDGKKQLNLFERFQGAFISNYLDHRDSSGRLLPFYEIDTLMYSGSSGCPGFNVEGEIFGMQVASVLQKNKDENKTERIAISLAVPSVDILKFLDTHGLR
jgi:S1-C subfamily serine protease